MRFGKRWKVCLVFVTLVLGLYITHPVYLAALGRFLVVSDPLAQADAIIVLSGGIPKDERLLHAIQLWQNGYASTIVLSAVLAEWQSYEDYPPWRHATKLNILPPESLLVASHNATSTKEEALRLLPFVRRRGYKKVLLVTSNYHTRRAKKVFQEQWAGSAVRLFISAAPSSDFHPNEWWTHRSDSQRFYIEFSKTLWYAFME